MKKIFSVFLAFTLLLALPLPAFAEEQSANRDKEYCGIRYTVPASWEPAEEAPDGCAYYTEITCEGRTEPAWCWFEFFYIDDIDPDDTEQLKQEFIDFLKTELGSSYFGMGTEDISFAGKQGFMHSYVFSYEGEETLYAAHCIAEDDVLICFCASLDYHAGPLINHELYGQVMSVLDSVDISGFDRDAAHSFEQPQPENKVTSI